VRLALAVGLMLVAGEVSARPFPAAWLPKHGNGYLVPDTWAARGLRYGRPELVRAIQRAAQRVARELPGALLYVGDLSLRNGARTPWHASHRRGTDADLLFYAVDADGLPCDPPHSMPVFDDRGDAVLPDGRVLRFDVARNWALVKALLRDREARVVRIFVARPLRAQLLAYAFGTDEPRGLIARAAEVLQQPPDSLPHDDHFHVRIAGPPDPPRVAARKGKPLKAVRDRPQKLQRHPGKRR
jgi:penicillin-insensitive murein endopeptidase